MNDEEIEELKKLLEEYSNELDKLYSSDDTKSPKKIEKLEQKVIVLEKEKKELEQEKKDIEIKKTSINNELSHAVHIMKKNILKN